MSLTLTSRRTLLQSALAALGAVAWPWRKKFVGWRDGVRWSDEEVALNAWRKKRLLDNYAVAWEFEGDWDEMAARMEFDPLPPDEDERASRLSKAVDAQVEAYKRLVFQSKYFEPRVRVSKEAFDEMVAAERLFRGGVSGIDPTVPVQRTSDVFNYEEPA